MALHGSFARARRPLAGLIAVSTVLAGAAWWRAPGSTPLGVVVITLDTTRADRLGAYGYMDGSTPHIDRLAREGVVFDQATTVAPLTLPAHCSLFTGLFPPAHGVRDNADPPLAPERTTLAEILRGRGFRTAAFVGSVVLDEDRGLAQGFEQYGGVPEETRGGHRRSMQRRGDEVVTDALRWLDGVTPGASFFLWAHLYDPHRPYDAPEPYRSSFTDPYVAELAFVDAQIGRVIGALERRGLLDRTLIVLAADHGESLGDHGERDHGVFVYQSVLHVPLIVRGPTLAPRRVGKVVRLVDVMPTVLDLLGLPHPQAEGTSVAGMLRGDTGAPDLDAYAESLYPRRFGLSPLRTLRAGRYKLIQAPRPELYDLERDPFELRNIYEERPDVALALARPLNAVDRSRRAGLPHDRELEERLASLGYIGSGASGAETSDAQLPDPKDHIDRVRRRADASAPDSGRER